MIVEHRGTQLTGERQQLVHRLARQALGLGQLPAQVGRGVLDRSLEPQRDRGERLVDLVVKVLRDPPALALLGLDRGSPRVAPLGLERRDHPVERVWSRCTSALSAIPVGGGGVRGRGDRSISSIAVISSSSGLKRRLSSSQLPSSVAARREAEDDQLRGP